MSKTIKVEIACDQGTEWRFNVNIHDANNISAAKKSLDRYLFRKLNLIREDQPILKEVIAAKEENKQLLERSARLTADIDKEHHDYLRIISKVALEDQKLKRYQALTEQSKLMFLEEKRKFDELRKGLPKWLVRLISNFYTID